MKDANNHILFTMKYIEMKKTFIGQTVIAPYMKDANNHILFTMKYIEMKLGRDVYGERLHLPTTFDQTSIRITEVTADSGRE